MAKEISQESGESSRASWRDPTNYKSLLTLDRSGWAWKWLRRNPDYIARTTQLFTRRRLEQPGTRLRVITTSDTEEARDWGLHFRRSANPSGHRCLHLLARSRLGPFMNNIPRVSYQIDQSVRSQLYKLPNPSGRLSLPDADRSDFEIVRLLGNAHYEHIQHLLEFLNRSVLVAGSLVDEVLKQTDPMKFGGRLSELYLFCHIAHRMPGRVNLASGPRSNQRPEG